MSDINIVMLTGRLARDPELTYSGGGLPICKFDLALDNRVKKGGEWVSEPMFLNRLTVFGRSAEIFNQYMTKGSQVTIEGRLDINQWETKEGQKRRDIQIIVNNFRMGGRGGDGGGGGNYQSGGNYQGNQSYQQSAPPKSPPPPSQPNYAPDSSIDDDDIPF